MWRAKHKQRTGTALKGRKPAFTFTASPWDLTVREDGEVVPCLGIVQHEKALDGVRSTGKGVDDVDEDPAIDNARKSGRIPIPHEIEVEAFGKVRVGYMGDESMKPEIGSEGEYWLDAWTRIEWLHGKPVFRTDPKGYLDFHRRVLAFICPEGLTDDLIRAAEVRARMKAGPNGKPHPRRKAKAASKPDSSEG